LHPTPLQPGDPAPWFTAATASNPRYQIHSTAGRYLLLAFPGPNLADAHATLLAAQRDGLLDDSRAAAFLVGIGQVGDGVLPADTVPGLRIMADPDLAVARKYGLVAQPEGGAVQFLPHALLLDPLLRVIAGAPAAELPRLIDLLRRLPHPAEATEMPAPVLLLPRVFEPALCRALIDYYAAHGGAESGFMVERDGRTVGQYDHAAKRRQDCQIEDAALQAAIRARVIRRLVPEIRRAFQFQATRIERYIVARYDGAEGGHFRAHRDNTTPGTAHRRFAVTINLNDGFEGGGLWFPEYGRRLFRPPAGGACVFSCSILHEAVPVTAGVRFATLPFLYDDEAAKLREANAASLA